VDLERGPLSLVSITEELLPTSFLETLVTVYQIIRCDNIEDLNLKSFEYLRCFTLILMYLAVTSHVEVG
jgi:hypothetical protein